MKAIRFIILIAIFVLVGLAFISRSPEQEEGIESIDALMKPLLEMQHNIENGYPKLRGDMEKLVADVKSKLSGIDPKNIIPFKIPVSGSSSPQGIQPLNTEPTEQGNAPISDENEPVSEDSSDISKQMKNLVQNLKNMDAEELAQRMEFIRQQLKMYTPKDEAPQDEPPEEESPTEETPQEKTP